MPGPIKMGGTRFCPLIPSDLASLPRACLPHLKVSSFFHNCKLDMCNFQGLQQILCAHMSALTETCQEAGYAVKPWRDPSSAVSRAKMPDPFLHTHMSEGWRLLRMVAQAGGWGVGA